MLTKFFSRGLCNTPPQGNWLTGSKDGKWIQEREHDENSTKGKPTGVRIDDGHPAGPGHTDLRSQGRHGHVPGISNSDGSPWLPVRPYSLKEGTLI